MSASRAVCIAAGVALVLACIVSSISAQESDVADLVQKRRDAMKSIAEATKTISVRIRSKRDLGKIKPDAEQVQALAAKAIALFPPGSDKHPATEAKSTIWTNWPDFEAKFRALETESTKLANVDIRNPTAIAAQYHTFHQLCLDCHELYRVKK
jgi:cytochrome c556